MTETTNPKSRYGAAKPDMTLIPPSALILEALAMAEGARKYGPYNWRKDRVAIREYLAAAIRHIQAYLDGEEVDRSSEAPHLGHARASLGIVIDAIACGQAVDDRPAKGPAADLLAQWTKKTDAQGVLAELRDLFEKAAVAGGVEAPEPQERGDGAIPMGGMGFKLDMKGTSVTTGPAPNYIYPGGVIPNIKPGEARSGYVQDVPAHDRIIPRF